MGISSGAPRSLLMPVDISEVQMQKEELKAGTVVVLPKRRSPGPGKYGKQALGIIDDPPKFSDDGKRVLVRWGHMSDYIDVFDLSDLQPAPVPARTQDPEDSGAPAVMYADITPTGEILQVYSNPDQRGCWAAARYCKDWDVPQDISMGPAPVDYEIAAALGYRTIEVHVQSLDNSVYTLVVHE